MPADLLMQLLMRGFFGRKKECGPLSVLKLIRPRQKFCLNIFPFIIVFFCIIGGFYEKCKIGCKITK